MHNFHGNRALYTLLLSIFLVVVLYSVNHGLFTFDYHDPHLHIFSPDDGAKGYYFLSESLLLKPGKYSIKLTGNVPGSGSEIAVINSNEETLLNEALEITDTQNVYVLHISNQPQHVRLRLNYDPVSGEIQIDYIDIHSDHVIYKDNLIRHILLDFAILCMFIFGLMRIWKKDFVFKIVPYFSDPKNEISLFVMVLLTALVSVPLLQPGKYVFGIDTLFHYSRVQGVAADLKAGIFPPRVELFWLNGVGHGVGLFYPEILLILPALLLLAGFPLLSVYKVIGITAVFLTLFTHYWSAKTISKGSQTAGISAAIFVSLAIYRIQNQFIRDGLGEVFASIFLPLIITGLILIFRCKPRGWIILSIGFTGTLLSHTLSFVLAVIFTAVFLLTQIRKVFTEKRFILDLTKAALFSIGISAFFLFPMLEQRYAVPNLKINQIISGKHPGSIYRSVNSVANLLIFFQSSQFGTENRTFFYTGWPLLFVPFLGMYLRAKGYRELCAANMISFAGVFVLLGCTELFPWHLVQNFWNQIQFTWRFLQSAVTLLSLAGGLYVSVLCQKRSPKQILILQLLICLVPAIPMFISIQQTHMRLSEGFFMTNNHVGEGEYLPTQLTRSFFDQNHDLITCNLHHVDFSNLKRNGLCLDFDYSGAQNGVVDFTVPFVYYKGYSAEVLTENGLTQEAEVKPSDNGLVRMIVSASENGHVHVWYEGTMIQKVSDFLSLVTILCWILYEVKRNLLKNH